MTKITEAYRKITETTEAYLSALKLIKIQCKLCLKNITKSFPNAFHSNS